MIASEKSHQNLSDYNQFLFKIFDHPDDPASLTPAMILIVLENTHSPPRKSYDEQDLLSYGQKRYKRVQYLYDQFWSRWRNKYLLSLTNDEASQVEDGKSLY